MASTIKASNHLRCSLKEPGSRRAKSDATHAVHDYFAVVRTAMSSRRVYSLYVICRSTIEACAFATWVFDPTAEPAERLLRGLQLRQQSLVKHLKSMRTLLEDPHGELHSGELAHITRAQSRTEFHLDAIKATIRDIGIAHEPASKPPPERPRHVPSATQRIDEMLCDEMEMPNGLDAYHRMSGVAHSEPIAIFATWNFDGGQAVHRLLQFLGVPAPRRLLHRLQPHAALDLLGTVLQAHQAGQDHSQARIHHRRGTERPPSVASVMSRPPSVFESVCIPKHRR